MEIIPKLTPIICFSQSGAHLVWEEMVSACWCGLLAALSLLLDARLLLQKLPFSSHVEHLSVNQETIIQNICNCVKHIFFS